MDYCKKCLYPTTKPDLLFNEEGVCSACQSYENRERIDWNHRKNKFLEICNRYKKEDNYDCLIPVSGGKDSTFQVIKLLEMGLKPLCVTATTDSLSDIGRYNIENLKNLGVDYIEYTLNPNIRRKLNKICLEQIGDISWPEHVSIFTTPVRMAVAMNIPLIVWGENPQNEYGGPASSTTNQILDRRWLEEFGGLLGFRVSDLIDGLDFSAKDLIPYIYPEQEKLNRIGVTGVFLGYYVPWDGFSNAVIAQAHGLRTFSSNVEGSICNYENLDNHQTGIHDYFKFLKYGFGRATDIANNHIRRGRLSREDALPLVKVHDGKFPWTCLGKPLEEILKEIDMNVGEFMTICDRFT
ncbi:MAG: N-acetyl sugar amidotransferase, partial [Proteobacteria bacterium]|nr:N-acetyl sugar amidotransferase [Pseudomonadota bacterium]